MELLDHKSPEGGLQARGKENTIRGCRSGGENREGMFASGIGTAARSAEGGFCLIVYSCENGGEYTKAAILQEIQTWVNKRNLFSTHSIKEAAAALNVLYEIVVSQLTWECPSTLQLILLLKFSLIPASFKQSIR